MFFDTLYRRLQGRFKVVSWGLITKLYEGGISNGHLLHDQIFFILSVTKINKLTRQYIYYSVFIHIQQKTGKILQESNAILTLWQNHRVQTRFATRNAHIKKKPGAW